MPDPQLPAAGPGARVVHLVGRLDCDDAHSLLWPTVLALADAGAPQCVVLLHAADAEHARLLLPRSVSLEVAGRHGWLPSLGGVRRRVSAALQHEPLLALHLHGRAAVRLGLEALRRTGLEAPVFFHLPQQDHEAGPARLGRWLAGSRLTPPDTRHPAYVVRPGRVDPISSVRHLGHAVLARPVKDEFFRIGRAESAEPLIVTSGDAQDLERAQAYAQIAVLLAGSHPSMRFVWLGAADPAVAAVLKAAQVQVQPARRAGEHTAWLAQAWLCLAALGDAADARSLIHAMAAGVPVVARQTDASRDLVVDTLSGFLGDSREALLAGIARLVDSAGLRQRVGEAARERSLLRHGRLRFQNSLLLAHGLMPRLPAPADAGGASLATARPATPRPASRSGDLGGNLAGALSSDRPAGPGSRASGQRATETA